VVTLINVSLLITVFVHRLTAAR